MLTARSVIIATASLAILSIVLSVLSLSRSDPEHNTFGRDSYGTRASGHRAIYEVLKELEFDVERSKFPSADDFPIDASYVLWNPFENIIQIEPAYLEEIANWVRSGGRLVVALDNRELTIPDSFCEMCSSSTCSHCSPISILDELGLKGIELKKLEKPTTVEAEDSSTPKTFAEKEFEDRDFEDFRQSIMQAFETQERRSSIRTVTTKGKFDRFGSQVAQVRLPLEQEWALEYGDHMPTGRILISENQEEPYTIAASFPLEQGEIIVISNPHLASNEYLGKADNSVLLTRMLTGQRSKVIFDEFYHGLTLRGNALWLLTQRPYAVLATALLVVTGLWCWRQAIFLGPSRAETTVARRSLSEYIEAMSRFLLQVRGSPKYVLHEIHQGILWAYSKKLGLPPQQQDAEAILTILSRRDAKHAQALDAALSHANEILNSPHAKSDAILQAIRKVSDCHLK